LTGEIVAEPFLSEIRIFSFVFAPKGWAQCNGQLLPINQNQALFSLLGTTYGGDGRVTFALPDLRGQVPIDDGNGHTLGEKAGTPAVTVNIQQLPTHLHQMNATNTDANRNSAPTGNVLGPANNLYASASALVTLAPTTVGNVGGNQAHQNMMPYLVLNFCIALQGIFPSQT
jgi:microcystin-dependent protein